MSVRKKRDGVRSMYVVYIVPILVYTFAKREMKFTRRKTGLTVTPHSDGSNGWERLLRFVGTYNDGYSMIAR